jgi:LemA protein
MLTTIIIVALVAIVFFWFITTQRELVRLDELCKNALSQIEVQLNSRWDALVNLAGAAREIAQKESDTIIKTIEARRPSAVKTAEDVNASQSGFAEVMSRLMVLTENYPEFKSHPLYVSLMKDINGYEDKVRMSRMVYNDSATKLNRYVRQWPSSIIAGMLHFDIVEYLKIDNEAKRQAPNLFPGQNMGTTVPQV